MNLVLELWNSVYSSIMEDLLYIIGFIILPTMLLASAFGIAWPLVQYGKRNWNAWKDESNSLKKLFYLGLAVFIMGVGITFIILDWLIALGPCSAVFHEMPDNDFYIKGVRVPWFVLLTTRIQNYIHLWANKKRSFTWYQKAYIKFVYVVANKIDRTPHFHKPDKLKMEVFG